MVSSENNVENFNIKGHFLYHFTAKNSVTKRHRRTVHSPTTYYCEFFNFTLSRNL